MGVDEAGYGPNLGPLLVAATVWQVPSWMTENEIVAAFGEGFACTAWHQGCTVVPLGDSKRLYKPGNGLLSLEGGLLALLSNGQTTSVVNPDIGEPQWMRSLSDFIDAFGCWLGAPLEVPWYRQLHRYSIPSEQTADEIYRLGQLAANRLDTANIELLNAQAWIVVESEFNALTRKLGSKGQLLTSVTLRLVSRLLEAVEEDAEIFCDRHGGRKNYLPSLAEAWPEDWYRELQIGPRRCSYTNSAEPGRQIHFSIGGDNFPPTALASMLAKYLRERLMQAFNTFWMQKRPELRPTAGYPVDARRFRAELGQMPHQLGLEPDAWWRHR